MANHNVTDMATRGAYTGADVAPPLETSGGGGNDGGMEARVAKLEAHLDHIRQDIAEIKGDVRSIRSSLDSRFLWMISAFGAGFLTLAGIMAKGFGWM